jgi:hypothetical protein
MSRADADIDANVTEYLGARRDTTRYASFDYCFNYFRSFHDAGEVAALASSEHLQMSCLQLGFYLASWGMFRGKADLLNHSAKRLAPVVVAVAAASAAIWDVDADDYGPDVQTLLFDVAGDLRRALPGGQSQTLVTKTMLGVFGCVPAFDRFFRVGFGAAKFGPKALRAIEAYYRANAEAIDRHRVATLNFATGTPTERTYTAAKVIDMVFFVEGARGPAQELAP